MIRRPQSIKLFIILIYWGQGWGIEFASTDDLRKTTIGVLLLSLALYICKAEHIAFFTIFENGDYSTRILASLITIILILLSKLKFLR